MVEQAVRLWPAEQVERSMRHSLFLTAVLAALATTAAQAGTVGLSGTRSNISAGGFPGGRCDPALTVSFAPDNLAASGTTNLGAFSYTASHCIIPPLPAAYFDGEFEWTFADGTLFGTHSGGLAATSLPFLFTVTESLLFTGGTGRYLGASGFAEAIGTLTFGEFEGNPASFSEVALIGAVTAPGIPEPGSWAMMIFGFGALGLVARRRAAGFTSRLRAVSPA